MSKLIIPTKATTNRAENVLNIALIYRPKDEKLINTVTMISVSIGNRIHEANYTINPIQYFIK